MKKLLVAVALTIAASGANASSFSVINGLNITFSGYNTTPGTGSYTNGQLGNLIANYTGDFAATYLGSESGFSNFYVGGSTLTEASVGARAVSSMVSGERLIFGFGETDKGNGIYSNDTSGSNGGLNNSGVRSFVILANTLGLKDKMTDKQYDFLIGYNDSDTSDADYDDYVVGVGAVPVPAALPLLASALAAFGIARRKSKQV